MTPSLDKLSTELRLPNIENFDYVGIAIYPLIFQPPFDRQDLYFEIENITVVIGYGELEVPAPMKVGPGSIDQAGTISFRVSHGDSAINLENHSWAICYAPFKNGEPEPWQKISRCIATISLLEQNRVFQPCLTRIVSDQRAGLSSQLGPEAGVPIPPVMFKIPESTIKVIDNLLKQNLDSKPIGEALDWFYRSLNSTDAALKFLSAWIACETITESTATDVSKLVQKLHPHFTGKNGYDCTDLKQSKELFLLGRLHGVRGRLAHSGKVVGISDEIALYAQMMFAEMVLAHFSIEPSGILMSFLSVRRESLLKDIELSERTI